MPAEPNRQPADVSDSGWETIRKVFPELWPSDAPAIRRRVVLAMVALIVSKVATVSTPFFFKGAVDGLAPEDSQNQAEYILLAGQSH